jgi:hypothetical protein
MEQIFLAHISDLHTGSRMYGNQLWHLPIVSAQNGHDSILCNGLTLAWRGLRATLRIPADVPIHVAVTGDLTRIGAYVDFGLNNDFLRNTWPPQRNFGVRPGMSLGQDEFSAVPGNHDQWAGAPYIFLPAAYNPFPFRRWFGAVPWGPGLVSRPKGKLRLEIYGVDSNSGLQGGLIGFTASQNGRIASAEFTDLKRRLASAASPPSGTVRVRSFVVHHSFDNLAAPPAPLDPADRDQLLNLAGIHDVRVVLSGHTHYWVAQPWPVPKMAPTKEIWELRSPSTLQGPANAVSGQVVLQIGPSSSARLIDCNGFLVHEIRLKDGATEAEWLIHPFLWNGTSFVNCPPMLIPFT